MFYTYWDPTLKTGQPFRGDFRTVTVDGADLFVADVNTPDLQSQEYVLLSGRTTVSALRREAREAGLPEELLARITSDSENDDGSGDHSSFENGEVTAEKATFLVKFYRDGEGHVCFEKSVRGLMLRSVKTSMTRYPVACFNWMRTKGSYHGTSPLTELIPNQKYVNKAYAMVMKHMADTPPFPRSSMTKSSSPSGQMRWDSDRRGIRRGHPRGGDDHRRRRNADRFPYPY